MENEQNNLLCKDVKISLKFKTIGEGFIKSKDNVIHFVLFLPLNSRSFIQKSGVDLFLHKCCG